MPIGCAAYQATQQPDKKNLAVLTPGIDRKNVIAELGQPLCTEMRGQTLTDVFAFKQGYTRGTKAGRRGRWRGGRADGGTVGSGRYSHRSPGQRPRRAGASILRRHAHGRAR